MNKKAVVKKSRVVRKKKSEVGDVIRIQDIGSGTTIAAGRGARASALTIRGEALSSMEEWIAQINKKISTLSNLSQAEKEDLKQQIKNIGEEAQKGSKADVGRLEKLINTLSVMAPDIFDVVIATIANPLAGIGLIVHKIGDKAKLEKNTSKA